MNNLSEFLRNFYANYNPRHILKTYLSLPSEALFPEFYKSAPFEVEIRMKNNILAMQIKAESLISMELMVVIGHFFRNYSRNRNCVWTEREDSVRAFFSEGLSKFRTFGGKLTFTLSDEDKHHLVRLLTSRMASADDELIFRLCKKFNQLETMSWHDFYGKTVREIENEKTQKHIEKVTCMDLPLDWENVFLSDTRTEGVHTDSISDGLIYSLNNLGKVDIEYISQITGQTYKTVISALKGSIYQNPETWGECFYKGWETADEYLSGRVCDKWKSAKAANKKYNGYFEENVKALEKIMPTGVSSDEIYITLGSPWVPADIIDEFIEHLLGHLGYSICSDNSCKVKYDPITGTWHIPHKARYNGQVLSRTTYGTKRMEALYIIERTLNMKTLTIKDEIPCATSASGKKKVINQAETIAVIEKQKAIIKEFQSWVWKDPVRKDRLETIFSEKFGSSIIRRFDGSFLEFPRMSETASLYDYQKNAVARIMFSPNTLLAHDVGSGKTYIMATAGMELKRLGISDKNLYVVPNNIVGQWRDIFLDLYPNARVLCVDPKIFTTAKRKQTLELIRDGDFDAIIMAYSCFEMIPLSYEYYEEVLNEQIERINQLATASNKATAQLKKKKDGIKKQLEELKTTLTNRYDAVYFDQLGINTLFVDEAHNYKNLPIQTKITNTLGISTKGSKKCQDMYDKVHLVQKQNNGRGVVMATGTPITNSLTDIFVMQKYLQNGELALLDLQSFDSWVGMFAQLAESFEVDVDTTQFRMATRFSQFHNLPELSVLLASVADFHKTDTTNGIPDFSGYTDAIIPKTPDFELYLKHISSRTDDVRNHTVSRTEDNMLKITTDGRKAALDLRLAVPASPFSRDSKVVFCAENVFDIYMKTRSQKSTQLIFCDTSTPKKDFNIYDELRELLVHMGIPRDEIEFVHNANTEAQRKTLFSKVRAGDIRILLGSTFKLGIGVNVQDKLIAIHHLDVPWRPSDMIQREGRILRQGNSNKSVDIFRYITEGSFDAYSWQLLETKQNTITEILSGCISKRECDDIDDSVLSYAEVKALAIGNPLIKERVEKANQLSRYLLLQHQLIETNQSLERELAEIPSKISYQSQLIEKCKKDIEHFKTNERNYKEQERKSLRQKIYSALLENELSKTEKNVGSYQGFDIILPTNMSLKRPYIYVQNQGRYPINMGITESGVLVRIDNFFQDFSKHLEMLLNRKIELESREGFIKVELAKQDGYSDIIKQLKNEIKKLDRELGVDK